MNRTYEEEQELKRLIVEQYQDVIEGVISDDTDSIAFIDSDLKNSLNIFGCYIINKCATLDEYDRFGESYDEYLLSTLQQINDE